MDDMIEAAKREAWERTQTFPPARPTQIYPYDKREQSIIKQVSLKCAVQLYSGKLEKEAALEVAKYFYREIQKEW